MGPGLLVIALCIYLLYLTALTLSPFTFHQISETGITFSSVELSVLDVILNIIGFALFGLILYWLHPGKDGLITKFAISACVACLLSTTVEILQAYIPGRDSSLIDIVTNTVGAGLGFVGGFYMHQRPWCLQLVKIKTKLTLLGLAIYLSALGSLFVWTVTPQSLDDWDAGYPLLIGNEATLDRPWLGTIFSSLMFDRVLTHKEIDALFQIGPLPEPNAVLEHHPVVAYIFNEQNSTIVHDQSNVDRVLDMQIMSPERTVWLPKGGLKLQEQTALWSVAAPEKVYQKMIAAGRFSIAIWFQPTTVEQYGPARIVSLSISPGRRNFTIGQEGTELHFRVRNRVSGPNGTTWDLRTVDLDLLPKPTHAVLIYDKGSKSLYVNGKEVCKVHPPDALAVIARSLHFDPHSSLQRWIVGLLLVGVAGLLLCVLAIQGPRS